MTKRLACWFCATSSVAVFLIVAVPATSFGGTCIKKTPSSLFHYSSQATCEFKPIPGFLEMWLPSGGEWILGEFVAWRVGGVELTGSEAIKEKATEGTYIIRGEVGSVKTKTTCTLATVLSGDLEAEGTTTANLDFSECTVNEPANCTIEQPINLKAINGDMPTAKKVEIYPKEGEVWAELSYTGSSCGAKGSYKLTGGQACELDAKIETEEAIHSMTCATTGSDLSMACKGAMMESTAIDFELEGGKKYRS
jgi:hypothetical protein